MRRWRRSPRPGLAGALPERAELGACRQECERLTETIKVRAIELALHGEGNAGALRPGPARLSVQTKLELLGVIDRVTAVGWSDVWACAVL